MIIFDRLVIADLNQRFIRNFLEIYYPNYPNIYYIFITISRNVVTRNNLWVWILIKNLSTCLSIWIFINNNQNRFLQPTGTKDN